MDNISSKKYALASWLFYELHKQRATIIWVGLRPASLTHIYITLVNDVAFGDVQYIIKSR